MVQSRVQSRVQSPGFVPTHQHPLQQYCILYLHREKELDLTSFGFMRAFSRTLAVSAVSLLQVHKDVQALWGITTYILPALYENLRVASFPGPAQLFVACSTFTVLIATESWAGPGNKATLGNLVSGGISDEHRSTEVPNNKFPATSGQRHEYYISAFHKVHY